MGGLAGGAGPAMTTQLELFLQGGLGNQLIQLAYADSLQVRTGSRVRINPVLLHPIWSRLRSISRRERCWPWASTLSEAAGLPSQALGLVRLYSSRLQKGPLTDRFSDAELLQKITASPADGWHGLLGYFQRYQALGSPAQRFWSHLKQQLLQRYSLKPFLRGHVAAHIRLGDYTTQSNRKVYAALPIGTQISTAMRWRDELGGNAKVDLITDDPRQLETLIPSAIKSQCRVLDNQGENLDFATLCSYQSIVTSNSTYSLVAAKLASVLWGKALTAQLPDSWYQQKQRNQAQILEWRQLSFVSDFWSGTD